MTDYLRTPDVNFESLKDFPFEPNWHYWKDLRMHYVDEGPKDGPVILMIHGMPSWSYLYRDVIPPLVSAGYRCIAPDHFGFGKSDKPTDINWYTIARHTEILTSLIVELDLRNITILTQDWGGPTGLAQAVTMPDRFDRVVIMNTWLHHEGYEYLDAIKMWNMNWNERGAFDRTRPDVGLVLVLTAGLISGEDMFTHLAQRTVPEDWSAEAANYHTAYNAPYKNMPDQAFNGLRRFPLSIPLDDYVSGNGPGQELHYKLLLEWEKPVHFIWGAQDTVFTLDWGKEWSERMTKASDCTFDTIEAAGHFLQNTHGSEIAEILLNRLK